MWRIFNQRLHSCWRHSWIRLPHWECEFPKPRKLWGEMFLMTKNDCGDFALRWFFYNLDWLWWFWWRWCLELNLGDVAASCARTQTIATSGSFFLFFFLLKFLYTLIWEFLDWFTFYNIFCNVTENHTSGHIFYIYNLLLLLFHQTAFTPRFGLTKVPGRMQETVLSCLVTETPLMMPTSYLDPRFVSSQVCVKVGIDPQ